jgi:hypothetical protein
LLLSVFVILPLIPFAQSQNDVNRKDHFGEAVQELIDAGANLNARETHTGRTALIYAVLQQKTQVAEALIKAGADVNLADASGRTALILAALWGQAEMVEALIKAGANLNQRETDGATALSLAAWNCHADIVRELMKAGATPEPTAWRKLRPPLFQDFPVSTVYKGPHAPVDLSSNPEAQTYRTRLRDGATKPPNFAGHYVLVDWGCGTQCTAYMLVDVKNGRVFAGPPGSMMWGGGRVNSSLFIANAGSDNPGYPVRHYHWSNGTFNLICQQPCRTMDGQECKCVDMQRLLFEPLADDKSP